MDGRNPFVVFGVEKEVDHTLEALSSEALTSEVLPAVTPSAVTSPAVTPSAVTPRSRIIAVAPEPIDQIVNTPAKKLLMQYTAQAMESSVYMLFVILSIASFWYIPIEIGPEWNAGINLGGWIVASMIITGIFLCFGIIAAVFTSALYACNEDMLTQTSQRIFYAIMIFAAIDTTIIFIAFMFVKDADVGWNNFIGMMITTGGVFLAIGVVYVIGLVIMSICPRACSNRYTYDEI